MLEELGIPELKMYSEFTKVNGSYYDYKMELYADKEENHFKIIELLKAKGWEEVKTVKNYRLFLFERHVIKLGFYGGKKL